MHSHIRVSDHQCVNYIFQGYTKTRASVLYVPSRFNYTFIIIIISHRRTDTIVVVSANDHLIFLLDKLDNEANANKYRHFFGKLYCKHNIELRSRKDPTAHLTEAGKPNENSSTLCNVPYIINREYSQK